MQRPIWKEEGGVAKALVLGAAPLLSGLDSLLCSLSFELQYYSFHRLVLSTFYTTDTRPPTHSYCPVW